MSVRLPPERLTDPMIVLLLVTLPVLLTFNPPLSLPAFVRFPDETLARPLKLPDVRIWTVLEPDCVSKPPKLEFAVSIPPETEKSPDCTDPWLSVRQPPVTITFEARFELFVTLPVLETVRTPLMRPSLVRFPADIPAVPDRLPLDWTLTVPPD